jgi:hypothetical protein
VYAIGLTRTRDELPAEREWIRCLWQALLPHARGIGSYVNAMVELEPDRIRASYGPAKYARLAEIKRRYDPDNLFHLNANIPRRNPGTAQVPGTELDECPHHGVGAGDAAEPQPAGPGSQNGRGTPVATSDGGTERRPALWVSAHQSGTLITTESSRRRLARL